MTAPVVALAMGLALLLGGCATPQPSGRNPADIHAAFSASPAHWVETDAVVTISNPVIATEVRNAILEAPLPPELAFSDVQVSARSGALALHIEGQIGAGEAPPTAVRFNGYIMLSYASSGLSWRPVIESVEGEGAIAPDDATAWVMRANNVLASQVVAGQRNHLGLRLQPPSAVALRAGLPGLGLEPRTQSFPVDGAYTVAASMVHTDAGQSVVALDLEFVDGLSYCASDFSIGRAAFATEIRDREPRNLVAHAPASVRPLHYFTEVSETRRPFTLVHYWFADGRAVDVTELPVEPSARWRTWSSLPAVAGTARHIEVFAADRDSGCILSADHIQVAPATGISASQFNLATSGFTTTLPGKSPAGVELSRVTVADTLNKSLRGARFALQFETPIAVEQAMSGALLVRDAANLQCAPPDCSVKTECPVDFSRCTRMQDSRECTTCLFRNPLNNRCISEQVDSACEARKTTLNERYSREWEACMAREESAQAACQERGQEAIEVCETRAAQFVQACTANQQVLQAHNGPVAVVSGEGRAQGTLAIAFSELQVSGDMAALKGMAGLAPNLEADGTLAFAPGDGLGSLADCIGQWSAPFQSNFDRPQATRRLAAPLGFADGTLSSAWPGLTLPLAMNRGPVESILSDQPAHFANCMPGLEADDTSVQATGSDDLLLRGILAVDVVDAAAHIALPAVSFTAGGAAYSADALAAGWLYRYAMEPAPRN